MHTKNFSRSFRRLAWAVTLIVPLSACDLDEVLKVNDPDTVNPGTLDDPRALGQVVGGAIRDFQDGYQGGGDQYAVVSALISDEYASRGTFSTRTATDRRNQQTPANGNTSDGAYVNLQFARRGLKDAAERLEAANGTSDPDWNVLKALEGYTYLTLAEGYCGYLPFSNVEDGAYVEGAPISATQALEQSLPLFDAAIGQGSSLAKVGKARALLNLGRYSEAAAAVSGIATTYTHYLEYSSSSTISSNGPYSLQANGRYTVANLEGGNGLAFRAPGGGDSWDPANADPRIPWYNDGPGFDPSLGDVALGKYFSFDDDLLLADGVEARLIEAEAAFNGGGDWLGILNALRAQSDVLIPLRTTDPLVGTSLAPLVDPGNDTDRLNMIMSERAFWMYGTGHRLGDLRRLIRNYGRSNEAVFPTGDYFKGGSYGGDIVFPLDFDEQNNTLFNPDQCLVGSAN